ncbi:ATP-binding protein [Streptomyces sp. NPDC001070]
MASSHDAFLLIAQGAAVADARRRIGARLCEWGIAEEVRDDAAPVVTELFTNAPRYSDSEKIACSLRVDSGRVHVEVAEQGPGLMVHQARVAGPNEEGGRGLLLVRAISRAWGVVRSEDGRGTVVWAELGAAADLP